MKRNGEGDCDPCFLNVKKKKKKKEKERKKQSHQNNPPKTG